MVTVSELRLDDVVEEVYLVEDSSNGLKFRDVFVEYGPMLFPGYMGLRLYRAANHLGFKKRVSLAAGAELTRLGAYFIPVPFTWIAATAPYCEVVRRLESIVEEDVPAGT